MVAFYCYKTTFHSWIETDFKSFEYFWSYDSQSWGCWSVKWSYCSDAWRVMFEYYKGSWKCHEHSRFLFHFHASSTQVHFDFADNGFLSIQVCCCYHSQTLLCLALFEAIVSSLFTEHLKLEYFQNIYKEVCD